MALDGIFTHFAVRELQEVLQDARLDKITQPERYGVLLQFHSPRGRKRLYLSANPALSTFYFTEKSFKNPDQAPQFCMLLRKHLSAARLLFCRCPNYERLLELGFQVRNDFGDLVERYLILEVQGKNANLVLLNEQRVILDAIRHVDDSINRYRELMPARPYVLPPTPSGQSVEDLLAESREPAFAEQGFAFLADASLANESLTAAVRSAILGFSPRLAEEIVYRSGLDPRRHLGQLSEPDKHLLSEVTRQFLTQIANAELAPALYYKDADGHELFDFHALDLKHLQWKRSCPSLSATLSSYYCLKQQHNDLSQLQQALSKKIRSAQKHARKKYDIHRADLREAANADRYKHYGEILQSQLYQVKDKGEKVLLTDYYDPEQKQIEIPLKSELSPSRNVDRYFKLYRKAKAKGNMAERLLAADEAELEWLDSLLIACERAENPEDLQLLKQEFKSQNEQDKAAEKEDAAEAKHLERNRLNPGKPGKKSKNRPQQAGKRAKSKQEAPLPPRRFRSPSGLDILVGRNNYQNDQLSLRQADKEDLWFHSQKRPGSHVILRSAGGPVSNADLEAAASLAAWYSQGERQSQGHELVEIDYCAVKKLSKLKGARPGKVIYKDYQSILAQALAPNKIPGLQILTDDNP